MTDLLSAATAARDQQFADLCGLIIGLLVKSHPEELRAALGQVFDLTQTEEFARRAQAIAQKASEVAHGSAAEVREMHQLIHRDLESLERRLDALSYEIDRQCSPASIPFAAGVKRAATRQGDR